MISRVAFQLRDGTVDRRRTPIKTVLLNLIQLLFFSDLLAARFSVGLAGILHSICLLWPGVKTNYDFYSVMFRVMPHEVWALIFFMVGMIQWSFIFKDEFVGTTIDNFFSAFQASLWTFVCFAIYLSVYPPPVAIVGEIIIAWLAFWIWVRTGIDSKD